MRIDRITIEDLVDFAEKAKINTTSYPIIPITNARAESQFLNPAAAKNDVALLVAYNNDDRCIGYLGILPCFFCNSGTYSKVYALSTFFADPVFRGKGVANALMAEAIALKYDFLLAGFSPSAEKFYRKHPEWFTYGGALSYLKLRLNPSSLALAWLRSRTGIARGALGRIALLNRRYLDNPGRNISGRIVNEEEKLAFFNVTAHVVDSVENPPGRVCSFDRPHFVRDNAIVNWSIRHPWIEQGSKRCVRYHFSSTRERFQILPIELVNVIDGRRVGYLVLQLSQENDIRILKILDWLVADDNLRATVFYHALAEAQKQRVDLVEASNDFWPEVKKVWRYVVRCVRLQRGNFLHFANPESDFARRWKEIEYGYCDGDRAFT